MGVLGCLPVRYMQVHVGATSARGNRANFKVHLRKITQNYDADQKNSFFNASTTEIKWPERATPISNLCIGVFTD